MRAIYYNFENVKVGDFISITGDAAKHLQVVRIKNFEEILVLNGKGLRVFATVENTSKNQIDLKAVKVEKTSSYHKIHLAIACPKKEAFEDILKMAVELGVEAIYPITSKFSQYDYIQSERIERILESALIQSNNSYLPIIYPQVKLENFVEQNILPLYFFNSLGGSSNNVEKRMGAKIILIGPEGGFSSDEVALILKKEQTFSIHLPTPILRAPTAVASSIGYLLYLDN